MLSINDVKFAQGVTSNHWKRRPTKDQRRVDREVASYIKIVTSFRMKKDIVEIGIEVHCSTLSNSFKEIICQLQEETLQSMMKNLGEIHPELDNIHLSVEKGLKQMFPSLATFNTDMLKKICSDLGLNRTSYNERATLESLIINELILTGIEAFLTLYHGYPYLGSPFPG